MSFKDCIDEIKRAAGRDLTDDELIDLTEELQSRVNERQRLNEFESYDEAVRGAADDYAQDMAAAATIEKRNAAINLRTRLEAVDFVTTRFEGKEGEGLEALLVGVNRVRDGSRLSTAASQSALGRKYLGGVQTEITTQGNWKTFVSGKFDRDIARALWAINRAEPQSINVSKEVMDIAKSISRWQEIARHDANKAGAWIKRMEGYIVRQSHDMHKIRRAGYEAWRDEILPKLDAERTFGDSDPEAFLKKVWENLSSGIHLKSQPQPAFKGPRNIAKRASAERVLHFRDADGWFDYNERFGIGSFANAVFRGLEMNAQTTGLMRHLGTNPESNFNQIVNDVIAQTSDPAKKQQINELARGKLSHQLQELDGSTRNPVNATGAQVSSNVRAITSMSKLGGAVLSQFGDIPLYASEMRYQGRGMLSGIAESIGNLFQGRGSRERQEIGGMLGVYSDFSIGSAKANRFSLAEDDLNAGLAYAQQLFFKFNFMTGWTDRQRSGAMYAMAHRLGLNKGRSWKALDPDLQRVLSLYDIGAEDWGLIRASSTKYADGREYVTPDSIEELDDQHFSSLLGRRGVKPTKARIDRLRDQTADKIRSYLTDRMEFAVIEPDARTRAFMQRGTQRGTVEGEFMRFIGQFKSFPIAVIQKSLGREVYGRGTQESNLLKALASGNGELLGVANIMAWSAVFGYLSMSSKDMVKGRKPRDPLSLKTMQAAMLQGGGLGIYGDFLFGEANRFGGGITSTLAGPVAGTVSDLHDIFIRMRDGDPVAAKAFRTVLNNTPFINLFYTRMAMDYLFLYQIQEALSPGSLRRLERRIERENEQEFIWRPSELAR